MAEKRMSGMQLKFLEFSVNNTVYYQGATNPRLPAKGAVAKTIADSLLRRGYISQEGTITPAGRTVLDTQGEA